MKRGMQPLVALLLGLVFLPAAAQTYGPVRSGDSLWRAFGQLENTQGMNRFSWMMATLRLNPEAFSRSCSGNSLQLGARLTLPAPEWVNSLSKERAAAEFERQAEQWTAYLDRGDEITCSPWLDALEPTAQTAVEPVTAEPAQEQPLVPEAPTPAEPTVPVEPPVLEPLVPETQAPSETAPPTAETGFVPAAGEPTETPASEPVIPESPSPAEPAPSTPETGAEPVVAGPAETPASEPVVSETPAPAEPSTPVSKPAAETPAPAPSAAQLWRKLPLPAFAALGLLLLIFVYLLVKRSKRSQTAQAPLVPSSVRGGFRRRILWLVTLVVVLGQGLYAYLNVNFFQDNYLRSVQVQSERLGSYLRQDVEYVLQLGIPLEKLIKIEASLAEILNATPEIEFIEITDLQDRVIYYADHQSMERISGETRLSGTRQPLNAEGGLLGISREDTDLRLPITDGKSDAPVGYIQMRISAQLIQGASREIVWDIVTVILVSLLITFEFLGFFVNREFSEPLRSLTRRVIQAARCGGTVTVDSRLAMPGVDRVITQANQWIGRVRDVRAARAGGFAPSEVTLTETQRLAEMQLQALPREGSGPAARAREALDDLRQQLRDWLRAKRENDGFFVQGAAERARLEKAEAGHTPYHYVRPFVFLFFTAYNLPVSFFPMYVETLYEPLWGLPTEVLIGLPISVFMLFFAVSMLVVGRWLDRVGWFKPLVTGASIFMVGFLLTAFAQDYIQLLLFRAATAVGLGIGFMGFQQFVVENTDPRDRSVGLSAFIGAFFAGEIVGTVVGGMLADRLGYSNIFLLAGIVSGAALAGLVLFFRSQIASQRPRVVKDKIPLSQLFGALKDREFFAVVVFQAIPAKVALVGFLMYFVPLYLTQIGTLQSDIGRIAMCYALMLVFVGPLVSRRFGKAKYRKYTILVGGLITGAAMTAFSLVSGSYAVLLLVIALGIAHAFSLSSQASLIAETQLVRRLGTGTGMGVYRFWERVGNVSGPFIMAALVAAAGYQEAVVWLGIGTIISSVLYIVMLYGIPSGEEPEAGAQGQQSFANAEA